MDRRTFFKRTAGTLVAAPFVVRGARAAMLQQQVAGLGTRTFFIALATQDEHGEYAELKKGSRQPVVFDVTTDRIESVSEVQFAPHFNLGNYATVTGVMLFLQKDDNNPILVFPLDRSVAVVNGDTIGFQRGSLCIDANSIT